VITGNSTWETALAAQFKHPLYLLRIPDFHVCIGSFKAGDQGVTDATGIGPVMPFMVVPSGASQSISELDGQSSIGSLDIECNDPAGVLKGLAASSGAIGTTAMFSLGFPGMDLADFVVLHTMQLMPIKMASSGNMIIPLSDPQRFMKAYIFLEGGPQPPEWIASAYYPVGYQISDANGNVQEVWSPGTSGLAAPTWSTVLEALTPDGSPPRGDWAASSNFNLGFQIVDSNGNIQQVYVAGISGGTAPGVWQAVVGNLTTDGTVTWVCAQIGSAGSGGIYWQLAQLGTGKAGDEPPIGDSFFGNGEDVSDTNPRWICGNPIDIFLFVAQNELGIGQTNMGAPASWQLYTPGNDATLINPNAWLDVPQLLALRDGPFSGDRMEFKITSATDAKGWLEDQILKPLGLYTIVKSTGQLFVKSMKSPANLVTQSTSIGTVVINDNAVGLMSGDAFLTDGSWNGQLFPTPDGPYVIEEVLNASILHLTVNTGLLEYNVPYMVTLGNALALSARQIVGTPEIDRLDVVNSVQINMDVDDAQTQIAARTYNGTFLFQQQESIDTYKQEFRVTVDLQGLRTNYGGYLRGYILADRIFRRHSGIPYGATPSYKIKAFFAGIKLEVGDFIALTHPLVVDVMTGTRGITSVLCEVIDRQPNYNDGSIDLTVLDTRFMRLSTVADRTYANPSPPPTTLTVTGPWKIAPAVSSVPVYTSASDAQKNTYMFVSSAATGKYSNGDAGHTIF